MLEVLDGVLTRPVAAFEIDPASEGGMLVYTEDWVAVGFEGELAVFVVKAGFDDALKPPFNKLCARLVHNKFPHPNGNEVIGDDVTTDDEEPKEAMLLASIVVVGTEFIPY